MATFQQLIRKTRKLSKGDKINYTRSPKMQGCPQRKAMVTHVLTVKPKKPNSAIRKIVKARLFKRSLGSIRAVIPGIGHTIKDFDQVLFRAGRSRDIPGLHYKLVRGALTFQGANLEGRTKGRSKYGVKKFKKKGIKKSVKLKLLSLGYQVSYNPRSLTNQELKRNWNYESPIL